LIESCEECVHCLQSKKPTDLWSTEYDWQKNQNCSWHYNFLSHI